MLIHALFSYAINEISRGCKRSKTERNRLAVSKLETSLAICSQAKKLLGKAVRGFVTGKNPRLGSI